MIVRRVLAGFAALAASALIGSASGADSSLLEDFEAPPYLWTSPPNVALSRLAIAAGDELALPGQGPVEGVLSVTPPRRVEFRVPGRPCRGRSGLMTVQLLTTPAFDATTVDVTTVTLQGAHEAHLDAHWRHHSQRNGGAWKSSQRDRDGDRHVRGRYRHDRDGDRRHSKHEMPHEQDVDGDGDLDLVLHFRCSELSLPHLRYSLPLNGQTFDGEWITAGDSGVRFDRPLAAAADWSSADGLSFWYYGRNSGKTVTVELRDNRAPDPGPAGWRLVWQDEFDRPAGEPPNPDTWTHEIGDGTANGIPGWGNEELEYYTDSVENAAHDGEGHLAITALETDGSLSCYYGPCQYSSARLISNGKAEFAHGRIEARMRVPAGEGLWPAFWSLGTDIADAGWPQSGEIDIMEFVGRLSDEVFGTIHGPGYSGGDSFGGTLQLGAPVPDDFHVFAVEWQPGRIDWFVDGVLYHSATPADVAPNQWVFDHPFFLIMNLAVGGLFAGPVGEATEFPATLLVDYVRVYQAPDTAERFESAFSDDFAGWQQVELPFSSFTRSLEQPQGAPDDGLGLSEAWGYGFRVPDDGLEMGPILLDQIGLIRPSSLVVNQAADDGAGSLRRAIDAIADDGSITFDPGLAGETITLSSGPLWITGKTVTIEGSAAPGLTLSGGNADRMLIVDPGAGATIRDISFADGYAWDVGGAILDNGTLDLERVVVRDSFLDSGDNQWWKGGGGVFVGDGATLRLRQSTVTGNQTNRVDGGGIYARQGTTVQIEASTINGNVAGNVGGGIRMLGSGTISNSTLSGNTALAWHGGALFHTDGALAVTSSTITANSSAGAAVFVGTFTDAGATLALTNTVVAGNAGEGCLLGAFGAGPVSLVSGGHNVFATGSGCNPVASDQEVADPGLELLADNGGPTLTHALLDGSPAIDAGDGAFCPATDQRGVARPQGPECDVGAYEKEP